MTETFDPADAACWIARGRPSHHAHVIADAWRAFPDLPIGTPLDVRMARTRERTAMLKPLHEQIAQEGKQHRQVTNFAFVERKVAEGSTDSRDAGILRARDVHGYDWDEAVAWAAGNYAARAGWEARPPSHTRLGEPDLRRGAYNQGFLDGGGRPDDIFDVARRSLTAVTPEPAKVASPPSSRPLPSQWPSPGDLPAPASWHRRLLILGTSEYRAGTIGILTMLHERSGHEETTICLIDVERGLYLLSDANSIASGDDDALREYLRQRDYTDIVAIASEAEFARLDSADRAIDQRVEVAGQWSARATLCSSNGPSFVSGFPVAALPVSSSRPAIFAGARWPLGCQDALAISPSATPGRRDHAVTASLSRTPTACPLQAIGQSTAGHSIPNW